MNVLTPLEALKDLREIQGWTNEALNKRLDIIETALENYKELKIKKENEK